MSLTPEQLNRLLYLCGTIREGIITPEEFSELNGLLETNPTAQEYYLDYIFLCTDLCNLQAATKHHSSIWKALQDDSTPTEELGLAEAPLPLEFLEALGDYERKAQTVVLPKTETCEPILPSKASVVKPVRKISKAPLIVALTSLAAFLILMAYVLLNPRNAFEVAVIADTLNAKWSSSLPLKAGSRLSVEPEWIQLQRGTLKIETDRGVEVLVEGPAEFRFTSSSEIAMNYGRLFAAVSPAGYGFGVQTPMSRIIDLGTEFGIASTLQGAAELHVFKGKAVLIAGETGTAKETLPLNAGYAAKFDTEAGRLKTIPLKEDVFVKAIDSKSNLLWRGQKEINLADVVGGGCGFGTGTQNIGINPDDGTFRKAEFTTRRRSNAYTAVASSAFIDGVFIPNGTKAQMVSSEGHTFSQCPTTSGYFYSDICNSPSGMTSAIDSILYPVLLDKMNYSLRENPCIFLHANAGITFDLNAYRSHLPVSKIICFTSEVGISDSAPKESAADFWVLVDGQVRYHNPEPITRGNVQTITVKLNGTDRFLTLVATDGGIFDKDLDKNRIGYDWGVFGRPVLKLESPGF